MPIFVVDVHRCRPGLFRDTADTPNERDVGNEGFPPVARMGDAAANEINNVVNFIVSIEYRD